MNVKCNNCGALCFLAVGGYDEADAWMREHALSCYGDADPVGKFKSQATRSERNPERYQDRIIPTGNLEPASNRVTRRK